MAMIESVVDVMALPVFMAAWFAAWGGVKAGVRRLELAHRLFAVAVGVDLLRLGFDITSDVSGVKYWGAIVAQSLITAVALYLMVSTGRDADKAERKAMDELTGRS